MPATRSRRRGLEETEDAKTGRCGRPREGTKKDKNKRSPRSKCKGRQGKERRKKGREKAQGHGPAADDPQ